MDRRFLLLFFVLLVAVSFTVIGCKGKVEKTEDVTEATEAVSGPETNFIAKDQAVEPAQTVATEAIPPTATPEIAGTKQFVAPEQADKSKEIQAALKNAGFYTGPVDGKVGPKTKKAIEDFQKARGLKVDGKVGPKTWAELEKELIKQ